MFFVENIVYVNIKYLYNSFIWIGNSISSKES